MIGITVGFLSGLLGKGGSAISTPALQVFGGLSPYFALASPLPASIANALSGSTVYQKEKLINKRLVLYSLGIGAPATILGSLLTDFVPGEALMGLTAVFVCGLGLSFILPRFSTAYTTKTRVETSHPVFWKIATVAIIVGGLSGLLANGGGILFAPLFIRWLKLPTKQALASSLLLAGGLAIPGTIAHWILGHIDWWVVLILSIGSIPGAFVGAKSAIRLKSQSLELIFGIMLCIFGTYDLIYTFLL